MEQQLSELPEGWEFQNLGSVAKLVGGATPSKKEKSYWGGSIPWASVRDLNVDNLEKTEFKITEEGLESCSSNLIPSGNLVIATRVGLGKVSRTKVSVAINQDLRGVIPNKNADVDYLFFWFKQNAGYIESNGTGATVKGVKIDFIKSLEIPLPPLNEQKRIVAKLAALLTRIDAAITQLQETLELSRALFASALDEAFRGCEAARVSLTEVVDFIGGSQPPKSEFSEVAHDGYVRLIQIRDYKTDAHVVYVNAESTKKFCKEDDVMIGRYGPPVFQILRGLEGAYNVALMKASPDEDVLNKDYLFWFLQSPSIQGYIVGLSQRAAGQSGVNKKALEKYEIPLPSLDEQVRIVEHFEVLNDRSRTLEAETRERLEQLTTLKSSLLDSAFRGQL